MSNILISGGAGYVGTELTDFLLSKGHEVVVLDRCFFGQDPVKDFLPDKNFKLIKDDIRYFDKTVLKGVDAVIDMAGISNDPSCDIDPNATESINYKGCLRMATLAKEMGVKRYISTSSCSVYGKGSTSELTETSPTNPVSLYAKTKSAVEANVGLLGDDEFCVTLLRNATVYGLSRRMRFDLAVNMMVLYAYNNRRIFITGQGQQWRPMVHVSDVAHAFEIVLEAPVAKVNGEIFNVGSNQQNYKILQIANCIRDVIPFTSLEIVPDDPDRRSYNVCFDKISNILGFKAEKSLKDGIVEIYNALEKGIISESIRTNTLGYYQYLLDAHKALNEVLYNGKVF